MLLSLLYFVSSLLIIIIAIKSFFRFSRRNGLLLTVVSAIYVIYSFFVFEKMAGLVPAITIGQFIAQQGFDTTSFPYPLSLVINVALCGGILFNTLTAVWIWLRGGLWKWCLTMLVGFCIVSACAGIPIGISPLYSLFGVCCAFMASVAWVLGLTYVEFCVIGNIWIPCAAIIGTAAFLVYASYCCLRSGVMVILTIITSILGIIQIASAIFVLYHYVGTMYEAFYRCVQDLKYLAALAHTSYEVVNIFIWVFVGVSLLTFNIVVGRCFIRYNKTVSLK